MLISLITILLLLAAVYLLAGVVFAIIFLLKGLEVLDEAAIGSTPGFKIIILPGCIVLWPILFHKWQRKIQHTKKINHDQVTQKKA